VDSRTRNLFVLALALVIAVGGGAAIVLSQNPPPGFGSVSDPVSIDGVIIGVESEGIDRVSGFTLRTAEGRALEFIVGTVYEGFPPGHLVEHQATAQPVRVWYQMDGRARIALRLEDAP
jgi:hypothetical protein